MLQGEDFQTSLAGRYCTLHDHFAHINMIAERQEKSIISFDTQVSSLGCQNFRNEHEIKIESSNVTLIHKYYIFELEKSDFKYYFTSLYISKRQIVFLLMIK